MRVSNARFLIRLDDACPMMNKENWDRIESLLDTYSIKPIVAIIPNNKDPLFDNGYVDLRFWDKVKMWENKGWTLALHGYEHVLRPTSNYGVIPFYKRSEFVDLSLEEQKEKIRSAWKIFVSNNVTPTMWVAPAHSFDRITIKAIKQETKIEAISDGFSLDYFYEHDINWIPQQLWEFRSFPIGLWTVCVHPHSMKEEQFDKLERQIKHFVGQIISIDQLSIKKRRRGVADRLLNLFYWLRRKRFSAAFAWKL